MATVNFVNFARYRVAARRLLSPPLTAIAARNFAP
jgi:hypothetical protein